ncbi:DUF4132 domain-containing protein [Tenacibaculum agarivorans]|uniref:DUF4132 domain-containing protein n=1 Tax=Tenacibaculum agarivorans TaxID=1908389 RepID=UPI00094BC320|nr:DUF4132 domain-containing protein [Tenacibaculum agarivorans]
MLNFLKPKSKKSQDPNFSKIDDIISQILKEKSYVYSPSYLTGVEVYENLKKEKPAFIKPFIISLLKYDEAEMLLHLKSKKNKHGWRDETPHREKSDTAKVVLSALMRKNQSYNEEEWIEFFSTLHTCFSNLKKHDYYGDLSKYPINYAIQQIERYVKKNGLSDTLKNYIKEVTRWEFFQSDSKYYWGSDLKKSIAKLYKIIQSEDDIVTFKLQTNDIGKEVNEIISGYNNSQELHKLLTLAYAASGGKPTKKFQNEVATYIKAIKKDTYRKITQDIITVAIGKSIIEQKQKYTYNDGSEYEYVHSEYLCDPSKQFIKGIVWTMESFSDKTTVNLLSTLLEKSYTKMPGIGPAAASIGNACAYVLGNMRGKDGLGALSRLKLKLKQNNIKKVIDKYLTEGAKKYNVSVEELKEMSIPNFNLENGQKQIAFEDYSLSIYIEESKVKQQWFKPDHSTLKSVPSVVKNSESLSNKLKDIRKEIKEIQKVYSAQKTRIDNQFILNRTWDYASFEKYYLHHGLVQPITSKLIWTFTNETEKVDVILKDNQWITHTNEVIDWINKDCTVQLWHPVFSNEEDIIQWREFIIDHQLKQPIKQAFRELYILTDAEINTRNYSNRMAAHILKQHQFKTLATLRDWKYSLMGAYDDGRDNEICSKFLPEYGITAEFWIDELNDYEAFNDAGIWFYIATDQVRFLNSDNNLMDLIDVPKIVFSEIMRDVDLFVGVCSVGNDPEWRDNNGARQTHRDYWNAYSFGDLNEIAKTRKTILARLLPRLTKIKNKTHIDGKFLIVKGDLRTYKIHIGSGNILMEPNDQYLCIVPSRSSDTTTDKLFIPFEGDRGLSIVLSKAFLLAEDTKITDTTITSQINRAK